MRFRFIEDHRDDYTVRIMCGALEVSPADVTDLAPHRLARLGVTRTFQNLQIFWTMTVLENVVCGFYLSHDRSFWRAILRPPGLVRRCRELESDAYAILRSVGLESRASEMANTLSYGELKRLEIARALATSPKVLFLDEPVAGCSTMERTSLARVIRTLADESETTIVLVEHVDLRQDKRVGPRKGAH